MALDIKSLSITQLFNGIKSFFRSQENNSKWKDLNTGAEGNFFMRMLSNILAVISLRVVVGRREQYHDTANFLASQIALAVNNGYSVCRGYNQRRTVTITSSVDRVLPKLSVVGFYDADHAIITMEPLELQSGKDYTFEVCIGILKEVSWTANTNKLRKFVRFEQNISEDIVLYLDGTEVPISDKKKDNLNDMYYVYTNPYKSVSVEYLNNADGAKYAYDTDSVFTLRYVELDDVESKPFYPEMFNIGLLTNTLTIKNFVPFEDIDSIKVSSPISRELQSKIRSKGDYPDMLKEAIPSIREVSFKALTPSYLTCTYIKRDFTLLEDSEYERAKKELNDGIGLGRPFPDITDPEREVITLDIKLGITDRYTEEADIRADVQNIVNGMTKDKLKQEINIYVIEKQIEQLAYVQYARVSFHTETRQPYVFKKKGDMVTETTVYTDEETGKDIEEAKTYKCTAILGMTSSVEPEWNIPRDVLTVEEVFTGLETIDNEIVWACYKRLPNLDIIRVWTPDTLYQVGEFVYSESLPNFMFKVVDIIGSSNDVEPDVSDYKVGDFLEDGNLLSICITYNSFYPNRVSSTRYRTRDRYNLNSRSFEVVGHIGYTGGTETLTFTDAVQKLYAIPESARESIKAGNLFIDGDFTEYIIAGDVMRVSLVSEKQEPFVEVPSDKLEMQSFINAKVKEYTDNEEDNNTQPTTPVEPDVVNYDINMSIPTGYAGSDIPDITSLSVGDTFTDGDLLGRVIDFDATYEARGNDYMYRIGEKVNIGNVSIEYIGVNGENTDEAESNISTTSTNIEWGTSNTMALDEEKVDKNANWKELEEYLEKQKQIHRWIISEAPDNLRTPKDVIDFYSTLGDGSRFSPLELKKLEDYYVEYNSADEEQIYLHMEQFGTTRLEAKEELKKVGQLGEPIADASCLRYYDKETKELVYVDRYNSSTDNYTIRRTDVTNELRVTRHYLADGTLESEKYETIAVPYVNMFLATVKDCSYGTYSFPGAVKQLTCIVPEAPIGYYRDGSYINLAFTKTHDGRVQWEEVPNLERMKFDWNVYSKVDVNIQLEY